MLLNVCRELLTKSSLILGPGFWYLVQSEAPRSYRWRTSIENTQALCGPGDEGGGAGGIRGLEGILGQRLEVGHPASGRANWRTR